MHCISTSNLSSFTSSTDFIENTFIMACNISVACSVCYGSIVMCAVHHAELTKLQIHQ